MDRMRRCVSFGLAVVCPELERAVVMSFAMLVAPGDAEPLVGCF
jgi:hypothetical protein